jgi:hypothetical protein
MAGFDWIGSWVSTSFSGRRISSSSPASPETDWQRYGRRLWLVLAVMGIAGALAAAGSYVLADNYADWAAVVVAGDWHAHDGSPSEIFDNSRRDVAAALVGIGFKPANVMQFSTRPDRYPDVHPLLAEAQTISNALWDLSNRTSGGCLAYFSSHGTPSGLVLGDAELAPDKLDVMLANACGDRPTVVVISACYSGTFVAALERPNRLVMTAARPDRTSFGCGGSNKYPYFDTCFLSAIQKVHDFPDLAAQTRACVGEMEIKLKASPPSEPQISMGADIAGKLSAWR